jgi:hypothetical protein
MNIVLSPEASSFLSNIFSSLLGTIVGAVLAYFFGVRQLNHQRETELRQKQIENALKFYDEFTSNEFAVSRLEAKKIFEKHNSEENLDKFYDNLPQEQRGHIRAVITFFRRLQLAVEHGQVDGRIVVDLLSGEFLSWHYKWLDVMVPTDWDTRQNIDKLNGWLKSVMPLTNYEEKKTKYLMRREERLLKLRKSE